MNNDLKMIKNKYGEKMMQFCRDFFSTILETPGLLFKLLSDNFAYSKFLYDDIIAQGKSQEFKNYIYNLTYVKQEEIIVNKTPKELLDEAGYVLYECNNEREIQFFKMYYEPKEELCTFKGGRLNSCHVFFAVKKNVADIKRENFNNPERQDEYGTSVISIQFSKGIKNIVSIKNRYNHTVSNPDATFNNNLDNIIEGLTESFSKEYNLNINEISNSSFELENYVKANDGKYYKYNYEIDNIYYCPNNIIIDNFKVVEDFVEKEKYLIIDYLILDLQNKKIINYNKINDCVFNQFQNINKIEIYKMKDSNNKIVKINTGLKYPLFIEIDSTNNIISYSNNNIEIIEDRFFYYNKKIQNLELNNAKIIGNCFCHNNRVMNDLCLPNAEVIGNEFIYYNFKNNVIKLPKVKIIGDYFLGNNKELEILEIPSVEEIGDKFMFTNDSLKKIECPYLIKIKDQFLYANCKLRELNVPNLTFVGNQFLYWNTSLEHCDFSNDIEIGSDFLSHNKNLLMYLKTFNINVKQKIKTLKKW